MTPVESLIPLGNQWQRRVCAVIFLIAVLALFLVPIYLDRGFVRYAKKMSKKVFESYREYKHNTGKAPSALDTEDAASNNTNSKETPTPTLSKSNGKKYLVYLCDKQKYCYGLGDRQRGVVSVYILALVTGRHFGIRMIYPSDFAEFYRPHKVNWDIPPSELKGKTSVTLTSYGKGDIGVSHLDFNAKYPQDVIYIRTNQKWSFSLVKNPHYKHKLPWWVKIYHTQVFQNGWMELMRPTKHLRQYLNEVLTGIAKEMDEEYKTQQSLNASGCCTEENVQHPSKDCVSKIPQRFLPHKPGTSAKSENSSATSPIGSKFCNKSRPVLKPTATVDQISKLKEFDKVNMNMVCVHVRIGRSSTLPFEGNVRNKPSSVEALWKFLTPWVNEGHHVYLASDSDDVRKTGKKLFGDRLHITDSRIVHIAVVKKADEAREGFRFALMEQLLLSTSCKVLVASYSGFSMKAAQVRDALPGIKDNVYLFRDGKVVKFAARRMP